LNPAPLLPGEKGLGDEGLPYYRFSLDDRSLTPDFFNSGAALLRTLGEEPTLADQQDPANLLAHLLNHLQSHPCRLQIDSLERLLRGNEQEGWSEFCDPLWLDLLQQFLAATDSPSQLLLTSQDIPADLDTVASRYPQFWHCEALQGLSADEQQTLFQKLGLPQDADSLDSLSRIGEFYNGHPLVLQVIADEIRQPPFQGNIARYWHHYEAEFTATPATPTHKLGRSRLFRRRVRQRVEQSLHRLPAPARQMLCASAVFRRPVPVEFWYAMLDNNPEAAFDTLQDRHLVEFAPPLDDSAPLRVRQHNLIRSVAYDLLKADTPIWEAAERQAAHLWLTAYEPAPNAPNLETVRGYLEAFDHYCKVGDWEQASEIYTCQLASTNQALHWQLFIWGYYKELTEVSRKLVDKITSQTKRLCLNQIGNSYKNLGNVERAIDYYQQALQFTRETGDRRGEGAALNNLGLAYKDLGQYERAIDFYQQYLTMAREIGDRRGEGNALGNLGVAYNDLGQYERAIDFSQQHLTMAREIGDRRGEGNALGNLGLAYYSLGQYERAIDFHQQSLTIAREIGDRRGEGNALGNLGLVHKSLGQYERAINFYQQALDILREIGDRRGEVIALGNLGNTYHNLGQYERAIDFHQQSLTIAREIGNRQGEGNALGNLGNTYHNLGQYERAIDFHQQYLTIVREIGDRRGEGIALVNMGETQLKLKEYPESLTNNQAALEIFQEIGDRTNEAEAFKNLAKLHQALVEVEVARQYGQQALALATELGIPLKAECETLLEKLEQK
jgi:tetratricopeptide (TPR) repeat protein